MRWNYLPPREELPLREEPELLDLPKPPDELGLLGELELLDELGLLEGWLLDEVLDGLVKERCDCVGLEMAFALAATFSALGEVAGLEMTGWDELLTVEPAVRDLIDPV